MVVEAVGGEIAAVDGEDFAEVFAFGYAEDGGVGEIRGPHADYWASAILGLAAR
jgi:hypothetical protein